jgi:hypothetical protein
VDLILSAAVAALFVLAAAAAWPAMYAMWSRAVGADTRELGFWQMLRRRGLTEKDLGGREREVARGMYRCIACHEAAACDARLAENRFDDIESFCPNRPLLDTLVAKHRRT